MNHKSSYRVMADNSFGLPSVTKVSEIHEMSAVLVVLADVLTQPTQRSASPFNPDRMLGSLGLKHTSLWLRPDPLANCEQRWQSPANNYADRLSVLS